MHIQPDSDADEDAMRLGWHEHRVTAWAVYWVNLHGISAWPWGLKKATEAESINTVFTW